METEHEYAIKILIDKERDMKDQLRDCYDQISMLIKERDYFRDQIKGMVDLN